MVMLMKKLIRSIKGFPLIWSFLIVLIVFAPAALVSPAESDRYAIVNSIGIDKLENDELELSIVLHVPMPTTGYVDAYNLVSAKGKNISEAISMIELQIGKELGLLHTTIMVLGKEFANSDMTRHMNLFLRAEKTGNNTLVVMSEEKAKDVLGASIKVEKETGINLSEIIRYNQQHTLSASANLEQFFRGYLSPSKSCFLPIVKLSQSGKDDGLSSDSASPGGGQTSGGGSSESGGGAQSISEDSGSSKAISNTGEVAVIKSGKYVKTLSLEDVKAINWITKIMDYGQLEIDNFSNDKIKNVNLSFDVKDKRHTHKVTYDNGFPTITYNIYLDLVASEVEYKTEQKEAFSMLNNYEGEELNKRIQSKLQTNISRALNSLREAGADCVDAYNIIYRNDERNFERFLKLVGEDNYLKFVDYKVNTFITIKN